MSALEVCFVRHAESVSNASGVWQGQGDSPLSERGKQQAEALAVALDAERFDLAIGSDLSRAADTGRAVVGDLELDPSWREIDVGRWEGMTMEEVFERFPNEIQALKERKTFKVGGGESWPEVFARVDAALARLRDRMADGGRVIVFTHGGIIASLLAGLIGARQRWPWPLGRMRNTGRTTLRFEENRVALVGHNDDSHLMAHHRQTYVPRDDQLVLRLTASADEDENAAGNPAGLDFNSAIEVARSKGAGEVMSVFGNGAEIATFVHGETQPSASDFEFLAPASGSTTDVLVSSKHRMLLDYGLR